MWNSQVLKGKDYSIPRHSLQLYTWSFVYKNMACTLAFIFSPTYLPSISNGSMQNSLSGISISTDRQSIYVSFIVEFWLIYFMSLFYIPPGVICWLCYECYWFFFSVFIIFTKILFDNLVNSELVESKKVNLCYLWLYFFPIWLNCFFYKKRTYCIT